MRFDFVILLLSATASTAAAEVDFAKEVLPILSNKCFVCHGPDAAELDKNMRRLDSFQAAIADHGSGSAVVPNHPESSLLVQRIFDAEDPMPPADAEKQLTDSEKQILKQWVQQGGQYAEHWAFVPAVKRRPPTKGNPIDAWIQEKLQNNHVEFAPPAEKSVLARRAALLLTGLPPTNEQLTDFLSDTTEGAYSRLVESLLNSSRFGEHQARYWLDAVRYGDTHGLHLDNRRGIYPYRDWVVRAFNQNLPLDDFIVWQLAGDLLPDPTLDQKIATGFVRMNPSTSEGGAIPAEFQAKNNFDRTETLGTVLMGMSLTCARCHTHKYDPITHREYYELLAFFNSTAESPMDGNKYEYGPVLKVPADDQAWQNWQQFQHDQRQLLTSVARQQSTWSQKEQHQWNIADAGSRLQQLAEGRLPIDGPQISLAESLQQNLEKAEAAFTTTLVAKDLSKPRLTKVLHRGEYSQPVGEALSPDVLDVLGDLPASAPRNRLGLARWLTGPNHPLVSRVLVNRIWQRVFGDGIVRTPEDFGLQGQQPTHPELLDWLAVQLQDSGWNLKAMLRLMVHSRTFRQSSAVRNDIDDPQNRLFARAASYRLDAEVLRDIGLAASGLLDDRIGGEGVKPYQPGGMWQAMAHPASNTKKYERDQGVKLYRRSLYVYWKRTSPHPMMTLFDAPDRESSCVQRSRTNTSLQSLGLLNETQRIEMARAFAAKLLRDHSSDNDRIERLFLDLTCRLPSEQQRTICAQLLKTTKARFTTDTDAAEAFLAIGDFKAAPTDPAHLAAWTQVCVTVLASDAAILLY